MKKIISCVLCTSLILCFSSCKADIEEEWHNSDEYKELIESREELEEDIKQNEEILEKLKEYEDILESWLDDEQN